MNWTLPNIITIVRIALTPVIALLPFIEGYWPKLAAFVVFVAAALSDIWDGHLARSRNLVRSFALGMTSYPMNYYQLVIGIGAWLGTIMLFNVWALIWPNQQKILGLKPASDEEKAQARKVAMLASRTNFVLSIPMLLCMGSATHGLPF